MTNKITKPSLLPEQLIEMLENDKGVTFNKCSRLKAIEYLTNKNNYLRTASYRKNYKIYEKGVNKGKYINLDFGYLIELSIIDTKFRYLINEMCLDVEHFTKLFILNEIDKNPNVDTYDIVYTFLSSRPKILLNIAILANSPFVGDLVNKYFSLSNIGVLSNGSPKFRITDYSDCSVWVLLELLTFGDFIQFYDYYFSLYPSKNIISVSLLNVVKSLRNGTSHNNCLLANLNKTHKTRPPLAVSRFVSNVKEISAYQRRKKLSCRTVFEFSALLYVYDKIIPNNIKKNRSKDFEILFFNRMIEKKSYFIKNDILCSTYEYISKVIKHYFQF